MESNNKKIEFIKYDRSLLEINPYLREMNEDDADLYKKEK
jgi:hypothetical protein